MERKRKHRSLNVGTSSILFIFVVLCLVSFSALSLSSALSDYHLSNRIADNTTDYYEACNQAYAKIDALDDLFAELYRSGLSEKDYYIQAGQPEHISIPVSDIQSLEIDVRPIYPKKEGDGFYEIYSWKLVTSSDIEYDDSLSLF
ncbi:MAG: hypothetical protein K6G57_07775 [Lachnospiraceae bacterium]|nr:hypothetical protein [Lachnospiraceae bacterium]